MVRGARLERKMMAKKEEEVLEAFQSLVDVIDRVADALEYYIKDRIESDKVLIGLLNDMNLRQEKESTMTRENENQGVMTSQQMDVEEFKKSVLKIEKDLNTALSSLSERITKLELETAKIVAESPSEDQRVN